MLRTRVRLIVPIACLTAFAAPTLVQSSSFAGRWHLDVTFADGARHSLRFEARASGRGSLLLQDRGSSLAEPARPSVGSWTQRGARVIFRGPVEFPIGNVGREAGTLLMQGTIDHDTVTGDVSFFAADQDPDDPNAMALKKGAFKGARASGQN